MTPHKVLPRGLRRHGLGYLVELGFETVDGVRRRRSKTFRTYAEAHAVWKGRRDRRGLQGRLINSEPSSSYAAGGWTISQALKLAFTTPADGNNKRKGGFKDLRSRNSAEYHRLQILRYFGDDFPIAAMRMATAEELLELNTIGLRPNDPITFDHFVAKLRDSGMAAPGANARPNSSATINRLMSTLRKTLHLAYEKGVLATIPNMPSKFREKNYSLRFYSEEEEAQLLGICREKGWAELEDLFIVLIDTGMRLGEAVSVERKDLDFKSRFVTVRGLSGEGSKNDKVRAVPMTARVESSFRRRMAAFEESGAHPPARRGFNYIRIKRDLFHGLNRSSVRWRFDTIRAEMGLADEPHFTIHAARHTCATRLVQRGVDIYRVMHWMGHSSVAVTQRYANLQPSDLLAVVHVLEPGWTPRSKSD